MAVDSAEVKKEDEHQVAPAKPRYATAYRISTVLTLVLAVLVYRYQVRRCKT